MTFWTDIRQAFRALSRQKRFTAVVVLTLGLAIAANAAVFHVVNLTLLRPLPFEDGERLYRIQASVTRPSGASQLVALSQQAFDRIRGAGIFEAAVAQRLENHVIRTPGGGAGRVVAIRVSAGWTSALGITPSFGRGFTEEEERMGAGAPAALLSHSLWQREFGGDPGVLGRPIVLEDRTVTVVGVLPRSFNYPYQAELWLPMTIDPSAATPSNLNVVARLRRGDTVGAAAARLEALSHQLAREAPQSNAARVLRATPLRTDLVDGSDRVLVALMGAVGFVLLIAAANVSSLLLARAGHRRREMAVRAALGATAGQRFRTVLAESAVLASLGGGVGALAGAWGVGLVSVLVPREVRELGEQGATDVRMAAFVVAATVLAGLIFALAPAVRLSGQTHYADLGSGARGSASRRDNRWLGAAMVAEIAMALLLSVGAAQMLDYVRRLESADPGFDTAGVLSFRVPLSDRRVPTPDARATFLSLLLDELRAIAGAQAVGLTSMLPVGGGNQVTPVSIAGRPTDEPAYSVNHRVVDGGYFEAMRIPVLAGRTFDDRDRAGGDPVALVSRTLAHRFWPGEDAIGKRMKRGLPSTPSPWVTVVGIVGDVREPADATAESWYLPYSQQAAVFTGFIQPVFVLRGAEPAALGARARRVVARIDAATPVFEVATLEELNEREFAADRLGGSVVGAFAAAGILLAVLGVYGVTRYGVSQRVQEIAIRIAFGAPGRQILRMILNQAAVLAAVGLALGTVGAIGAGRLLRELVPGLPSAHWVVYVAPAVVLCVVTMVAAGIPAWRATRIDPVAALQER